MKPSLRALALAAMAAVAVALGGAVAVQAEGPQQNNAAIARVRQATVKFHKPSVAFGAGWQPVPGLDYCFTNPAGGMGFHYINTELLMNPAEDPLQPEAMVYVPGPNGGLHLGAVEWIVPSQFVDPANPPELFGQTFHLDTDDGLPVYVLHAWIWKDNPSGMFEDWNPKVHCPA